MKPGIYIHIPFCEQRCYYCAFTVAVTREDAHVPYVDRLIREIELSGWTESPETIFLGGGTPSILGPGLITGLMSALPPGATEISLEANPGTLTSEKLRDYSDAGVNRISLGAQSFHDEDLQSAGRLHKASDVIHDFDMLRRHHFANINVDLIAGLPDQRFDIWEANLRWITQLQPEHVSVYMLELEERSPWSKTMPDAAAADDAFVRFYDASCEALDKAGYVHYEISNWARPGRECRHNWKYWTGAPYRGFGVGAHSFDNGMRFWNTASLSEYANFVDSGSLPTTQREILTRQMRLEESFMLGLRRTAGFNIHAVAEELAIRYPSEWFARVEELAKAGWIRFDGTVLKLTPAGWLVATGVTEELIWPTLLSTSGATP
jgi:putative oxygen-independent coproporphyrinogen III oxidase